MEARTAGRGAREIDSTDRQQRRRQEERCKICFAAWPGSHCDECVECGLGPQPDPTLQWVADRSAERAERRAELQRWVLESSSDEEENEDALETGGATAADADGRIRRSSRLQGLEVQQPRIDYREDSSDAEDDEEVPSVDRPVTGKGASVPAGAGSRQRDTERRRRGNGGRGHGGRKAVKKRAWQSRGFRVVFADDTTLGASGPDAGVAAVERLRITAGIGTTRTTNG